MFVLISQKDSSDLPNLSKFKPMQQVAGKAPIPEAELVSQLNKRNLISLYVLPLLNKHTIINKTIQAQNEKRKQAHKILKLISKTQSEKISSLTIKLSKKFQNDIYRIKINILSMALAILKEFDSFFG